MMTKIYMAVGGLMLATYLGISFGGVVFSGTDGRPEPPQKASASGRRPVGGGGIWWWSTGGYRGGK